MVEAERLQRVCVEWDRRNATSLLARTAESLSAGEKTTLLNLGGSLHDLAQIQRELGLRDCVSSYAEASEIAEKLGDNAHAAIAALNLGRAYSELPALRNLDEAEHWCQRALELENPNDKKGQAGDIIQLGIVTYERFNAAKKDGKAEEELLKHLNAAVHYYQQALALLPPDAVDDLAVTHNLLGIIYDDANDLERSLEHYNKSIQYKEMAGNIYSAGTTRFNIAITLANRGRLSDALLYARAALHNFESYGGRAKEDEDRTKGLIAKIEEGIEKMKKT